VLIAAFILLFLVSWAVVYATLPALRHVGRSAKRVVARSARIERFVTTAGTRYRDYLPVLAIVVLGALLTAWAGDAFLDLAEEVHSKNITLQQTDGRIHDWTVTQRSRSATLFFVTMTTIGGPAGLAVILAIVAAVLIVKRRYYWLTYLIVTSAGGGLINAWLKHYFARGRPAAAEMLRRAIGYSFPSGHAMGSTIAFGALSYLAFRAIHNWSAKAAVMALAFTLTAGIALSRVYLGVHWISDVGAGIVAGLVWVTSTTIAYETLRRIRMLRAMRSRAQSAEGRGQKAEGR
jgi:membrane-associated phospholipid phosphatase